MISVAEADRLLAALLPEPESELVPLAQAAGRLLAEPLKADRDGPPYDRVAMDGYAVRSAPALRSWKVVAFQAAGHPPLPPEEVGTAIEVATGAVLPEGCDTVIPYERTTRDGDWVTLNQDVPLAMQFANVHGKGEDYKEGDVLLTMGSRLTSPRLHSLATVGCDPVPVIRRAVWSVAATGDELVGIKTKPKSWQIRRSNAAAITGEALTWGLTPATQGVLPDNTEGLQSGIEKLLLGSPDVLVLTGGVSAGALDLVPKVLEALGAETVFHHIAQRPGKPLWCGRLVREGRQTVIFGLPGNPVSSLFAFRRYVLPWLLAFEARQCAAIQPSLPVGDAESLGGKPGQTVFVPWSEVKGVLEWKGSGDFSALSESTGFVEVSAGAEPRYFPWGGTP